MKNSKRKKAYVVGIIGAILWGVSFMGTKTALSYIGPEGIMAGRMIIAVATMGVLILLGKEKVKYRREYFFTLIALAIFQPCLYGWFEAIGINLTTASESAILLALVPIVTVALSGMFLKEKISGAQLGFIVMSFGGVLITTVLADDFSVGGKLVGYMFLVLAVLTAGLYTILSRKVSTMYSPFEITFIMSIVGLIFFNTLNFLKGGGFQTYVTILTTPKLLFILLFLGILCSVFAFVAYNNLIAIIPAHVATAITISVLTATGVVAGMVFLGEAVTWNKILGTIIIIGGVIGVNLCHKE